MKTVPKLLDTVAIVNDIPVERLTLVEPDYVSVQALPRGLIGTVVEVYNRDQEPHYLVEFSDSEGCEYAMAILNANELLVLHAELSVAS